MKQTSTLLLILFVSISALSAQEALEFRGMTLEEYQGAKALKIVNLEKDTYLKTDKGLIFDRENPPYSFKFSDGGDRKGYLFKIFEAEELKFLGRLLVYQSLLEGERKLFMLPIPGSQADKSVWGRYIDDIKELNAEEGSFSTCLAFVLSKESASMRASGDGESEEEEYEYCFPADGLVKMADGREKKICEVQSGEWILGGTPNQPSSWKPHLVEEVEVHQDRQYDIIELELIAQEPVFASQTPALAPIYLLSATPNHPLATGDGPKRIGELSKDDLLWYWDDAIGAFVKVKVKEIRSKAGASASVYNLRTSSPAYLVNGIVVFQK